ncbi:MAG: hypothetical protein ACREFE_00430 [Limisphaerales bacterium]
MSEGDSSPPYPFDPYPGCTVYSLGNNQYVIDDREVAAAKEILSQSQTMSADDVSIDPTNVSTDSVSNDNSGWSPMDLSYQTNGSLWIGLIQSKVAKKFMSRCFYRFCNAQQGFNGNDFFSTFDFANVFRIQIDHFSQLFLRKICLFPAETNGITDDFSVSQNGFAPCLWVRHNRLKISGQSPKLTPALCWYFSLVHDLENS